MFWNYAIVTYNAPVYSNEFAQKVQKDTESKIITKRRLLLYAMYKNNPAAPLH